MSAQDWLDRVGHDLVKRVLWPARDRRDLGGEVMPGELVVRLVDDEGLPIELPDAWRALAAVAPAGVPKAALAGFAASVARAAAAADADELDGVLALEAAFALLAQNVKGPA